MFINEPAFHNIIAGNRYAATINIGSIAYQVTAIPRCIKFHPDVRIGFLAHARKYQEALGAGELLAPAKAAGDMHRIIVNDYVNSTLTAGFLFVVVTMVIYGVLACRKAYLNSRPTVREYPEAHDPTPADDAADVARA